MNRKFGKIRLLAAAFALLLALSAFAPNAYALSGLAGKTIDVDTANATVGDAIREKANAARIARAYETKTLLVIGVSEGQSALAREDGSGMDAELVASTFGALGYRDEKFLADMGVSVDSAEEYLAGNDLKAFVIVAVEDLAKALDEGEIDLAAGDAAMFSEEEHLFSRAYFTGSEGLKTVSGEEIDLAGREFALVARDGAQTLLESLDQAIAGQYSGGEFALIESNYFQTSAWGEIWGRVEQAFAGFAFEFERNLIREDRYKMLIEGLVTTLKISGVSCVCGVLFGSVVALMRLSKNRLLRGISTLYVNIVRGTPVVVQLMIIYYIVLAAPSKTVAAMVTFSVNSAAYVSEMVRGGILAVDKGQTEAGRSLGLSAASTMILIVLPQMIKIIIPSLFNEFITLLKETSVVGFIGLMDLSKAGDFIRSRTYSAFFPLIAVAIIYLVLVTILTRVFGAIEGRLRKSDIR